MNCAAVVSKGEPQLASTANKRAFEIGWLLMCLEPRETKREQFSMGEAWFQINVRPHGPPSRNHGLPQPMGPQHG